MSEMDRTGADARKRYAVLGLFELTEDAQIPDSSRTAGDATKPDVPWADNCQIVELWPWDATAEEGNLYRATESYQEQPQTLYWPAQPKSARNSDGIFNGEIPAVTGDRVFAGFLHQSDRWEVIGGGGGGTDTLYKLAAVLAPGSTSAVAAYKGTYSGGSWTWASSTDDIQDPLGMSWGMKGDFVYVDSNKNITKIKSPPVYFVTLGATLNSGSTATATGPNSSSITVTDVLLPTGYKFASGMTVPIMPDVNGTRWVTLCPQFASLNPLVDFQGNDSTYNLQTKQQKGAVLATQTEDSSWTTKYTGGTC